MSYLSNVAWLGSVVYIIPAFIWYYYLFFRLVDCVLIGFIHATWFLQYKSKINWSQSKVTKFHVVGVFCLKQIRGSHKTSRQSLKHVWSIYASLLEALSLNLSGHFHLSWLDKSWCEMQSATVVLWRLWSEWCLLQCRFEVFHINASYVKHS